MKQLFPRGKRIRPTDKDLVFHTALAALFPVFLLVVLLFHIRQIAGTNWQEVSLSQITQDVNIPYLLFSMGVAGLVCLAAVLLFWRYRRDEVKQLIHRQKLARMVLENKWYESEQRKEDLQHGFCIPNLLNKYIFCHNFVFSFCPAGLLFMFTFTLIRCIGKEIGSHKSIFFRWLFYCQRNIRFFNLCSVCVYIFYVIP